MAAGLTAPVATADVLGAHLGYGRGCVMCHAPHSGAFGNGVTSLDPGTGDVALWGQDLQPLYGQVLTFANNSSTIGGGAGYTVTLPGTAGTYSASNITAGTDGAFTVLLCLSCHDGNLAKVAMMKGQTVETLPIVAGGKATAPTLLGNDGTSAGNYLNDHPVGQYAAFQCNSATYTYSWDCAAPPANTNFSGKYMTGTASSQFMINYGWTVSLTATNGVYSTVTCTTCHNQHSMNAYTPSSSSAGGLYGKSYATMFFIKGPYQPNTGGNNAAQFCRQCHGSESNEMAGVMNVVTN